MPSLTHEAAIKDFSAHTLDRHKLKSGNSKVREDAGGKAFHTLLGGI